MKIFMYLHMYLLLVFGVYNCFTDIFDVWYVLYICTASTAFIFLYIHIYIYIETYIMMFMFIYFYAF